MNKVEFISESSPYITPGGQKKRRGTYKCYCGNIFEAIVDKVKRGETSSCGCYASKCKSERRKIIYEIGSYINGHKYLGKEEFQGEKRIALFECARCKNEFHALIQGVKHGKTQSCGCLKLELLANRSTTHGKFHSKEYKAWTRLKSRCYNQNNNRYQYYGAKGIVVCGRWKNSFENFYADMGDMPGIGYTVERLDPKGNYEPSNCKWDLKKNQPRNKTNTIYIVYNYNKVRLIELCERTGLNRNTITGRLASGWDIDKTFDYKLTNLFLNI